jgi:hypothetical protein
MIHGTPILMSVTKMQKEKYEYTKAQRVELQIPQSMSAELQKSLYYIPSVSNHSEKVSQRVAETSKRI